MSVKALQEATTVTECLKRDGIQADIMATVQTKTGRVVMTKVQTSTGEVNDATACITNTVKHWRLDPPVTGEASLLLADDSADQDERTTRLEIQKTVRSHSSGLNACHQHASNRSRGLPPSGLVVMGWTIDRRRASDIRVATNNTGSVVLGDCLAKEIASWTFPTNAVGDVDWPFEFTGTGLEEE